MSIRNSRWKFIGWSLAIALLSGSALRGQPAPQATADHFFESVGGLTGSARSIRLRPDVAAAAADLGDRLKTESFASKGRAANGELRVGARVIAITGAKWWKRFESAAETAWVDVIELQDEAAASRIPEQWRQPHTGTTFPDAFAYITSSAAEGMDSIGAVAVRGRHVINVGMAPPFKLRLWASPGNSAAELTALDSAIDRLAALLETTVKTLADPKFITWIPPAKPAPEVVKMRRVASFARLWSEAKYNFVFMKERTDLDWESVLELYLPRIMAAESNEDYVAAMKEAITLLQDGHTSVQGGAALDQPPLRVEPVEERPVLTGIANLPEINALGLRLGMEVISVDGVAAGDLRKRHLLTAPASTRQGREDLLDWMLLQGAPNSTAKIEFRDLDGKATNVELKRNLKSQPGEALPWRKSPFEYRDLPGGIAYVALNSFGAANVVKRFDEHFDRILKSSELIIDVRENGGGSSQHGYSIVARLIEKGVKLKTTAWKTRSYKPSFRAWGNSEEWHEGTHGEIEARGDEPYRGPVVVLIGSKTFSAAEDFLAPLKMSKRATLIGTPTGGSTGQPLPVPLYQASARICTKWDRFADGTEFVGIGVQPDVRVEVTRADVAAGRDPVLEAALTALRK